MKTNCIIILLASAFLLLFLLHGFKCNKTETKSNTKVNEKGKSVNNTKDKKLETTTIKIKTTMKTDQMTKKIQPKMNSSTEFPTSIKAAKHSTTIEVKEEKSTPSINKSTNLLNKKNYNECPITSKLYFNSLGTAGNERKMNCTEPGCFYVYEQHNMGWDFPAYLVDNKKKNKALYLTGCRYDIPYLLDRNEGNERVYRAMSALRACYIGKKREAVDSNHCQPEYEKEGLKSLNQGMDKSHRKDGQRDTWAGRFLPSTQNRCFVDFLDGIFYVDDNGKGLVVCCNNGTLSEHELGLFKSACLGRTQEVNSLDWRREVDD